MVTKYDKQMQRAALAKRIRDHADTVHRLAIRVPFWHMDDGGPDLVMRDVDGDLLITFHGALSLDVAKWLDILGRLPGMALADLIRAGASTAEVAPGREPAL